MKGRQHGENATFQIENVKHKFLHKFFTCYLNFVTKFSVKESISKLKMASQTAGQTILFGRFLSES